MLDFLGEAKRVKSFAYGLPHLGSPGIHNLDTLAMKCDSNFTFILKPTYNAQVTTYTSLQQMTDVALKTNLNHLSNTPQAQSLKFYCYYPHFT